MGGIGSQPASGGGWGVSSGGLLSSLGGGLSTLAATSISAASAAKSVAGSVVSSAKESIQDRVSFDAARDLGHLSRGGSGGVEVGSKDLSDLLGGCGLDQQPPPSSSAPPASNGAHKAQPGAKGGLGAKAGWDDDWDISDNAGPSIAAAAPPPVTSMPSAESAPVVPAAPVSVHYGGASGATPTKRKVAAVKVRRSPAAAAAA